MWFVGAGLKEEGGGRGEANNCEDSGINPFHDVFNNHHPKVMEGMTEDKNKVKPYLWISLKILIMIFNVVVLSSITNESTCHICLKLELGYVKGVYRRNILFYYKATFSFIVISITIFFEAGGRGERVRILAWGVASHRQSFTTKAFLKLL